MPSGKILCTNLQLGFDRIQDVLLYDDPLTRNDGDLGSREQFADPTDTIADVVYAKNGSLTVGGNLRACFPTLKQHCGGQRGLVQEPIFQQRVLYILRQRNRAQGKTFGCQAVQLFTDVLDGTV